MSTPNKHTVTTDALKTLGTIIDADAGRDAIHLAVEPVIADEFLRAGDHVGFRENGRVGKTYGSDVGIVDPFLTKPVQTGQRFWLVVYPRQITSLRHVWEHPGFPASDVPKTAVPVSTDSETWLQDYASSIDVDYEDLMYNTKEYLDSGEYWCEGDKFSGTELPDEFWNHYEAATGDKVSNRKRESFFSCSC
jgi:hypothetical protein